MTYVIFKGSKTAHLTGTQVLVGLEGLVCLEIRIGPRGARKNSSCLFYMPVFEFCFSIHDFSTRFLEVVFELCFLEHNF